MNILQKTIKERKNKEIVSIHDYDNIQTYKKNFFIVCLTDSTQIDVTKCPEDAVSN